MNDYWNDPPEIDEPPECCGEFMDIQDDGSAVCSQCGKKIEPLADIEPIDDLDVDLTSQELPSICVHGNQLGDCSQCDYLADLAYDAARERKR